MASARWIFVWVLAAPMWRAAADAPPRAPVDYKVDSPSRRCYAFLDAAKKKTTVFRQTARNAPIALWEMPGWFAVASLSDDCEHMVIGFDGSNLLPLDYRRDLVMLAFYERGKLLRAVRLDELIRDFTKLQRTTSHYSWGRYVGLDAQNRYVVETVEGRRMVFDAASGKLLAGAK